MFDTTALDRRFLLIDHDGMLANVFSWRDVKIFLFTLVSQ